MGPDHTSDYGNFRAKLLVRIFAAKPTPNQVADCLESNRKKYPQIRQDEIDRYRFWGDHWPEGGQKPTLDGWEPVQVKFPT